MTDAKVSKATPWTDLLMEFHERGYTKLPFRCTVNSKPRTNVNLHDNSTVLFRFKIQGGEPPRKTKKTTFSDDDSLKAMWEAPPSKKNRPLSPIPTWGDFSEDEAEEKREQTLEIPKVERPVDWKNEPELREDHKPI
jgi:hypothetical protein